MVNGFSLGTGGEKKSEMDGGITRSDLSKAVQFEGGLLNSPFASMKWA